MSAASLYEALRGCGSSRSWTRIITTMQTRRQVFMSYSTVDAEIVKQVEKEFEPHFLVWRDERSTEVNWSREISQALVGSQVVCLFWSENAAKSSYVENEWLTATALEKPVVPCLLPGRPHLPDRLFNTQGIPFTGAWTDDRAKALPDL